MKFFIDLIAKSYLEYTQEKDNYIAQFYFQEFYKVRPEAKGGEVYSKKQFYNKLILKLDFLINKAFSKQIVPIGIDTLIRIFSATEAEYDDATEENENDHKDQKIGDYPNKELMDYYYQRPNLHLIEPLWETCDDAATLMHGINKVKIVLKDPISIINPSVDIYDKPMVLRKSKLEYLKKEAVRASEATTIAELDDPQDLSAQNSISSNESISDIESKVKSAFEFTLKLDPRKKKQILSEADNIKLVEWVTYYFENNFKLPIIENPILNVHTSDGNIIWTFKILFKQLHPEIKGDVSKFQLLKKCFSNLRNADVKNLEKRGEPDYYFELITSN